MSSHTKVAYVVKRYPRYSETFIVNEIIEHEKAGLELEIFALRPPSDTHFQSDIAKVRAPVRYLSGPGRTEDFWVSLKKASQQFPNLWKVLEENTHLDSKSVYHALQLAKGFIEGDITHAHAHFATSAAEVTGVASQLSGIPFSITAHAKDIFHESVNPSTLGITLSRATVVVTVSNYNVTHLNSILTIPASIRRIYNGMDLEKFEYSVPMNRKPIILSVGRLVEKKGFSDLIDACKILRQKSLDFECQIIGSGELESSLRSQIATLNLDEHVKLMGPMPQPQIVELLKSAKVFAAPCVIGKDGNRDGMPTVLLEAMASGTPCISTPVTGIPELIIDGKTGLMVEEGNSSQLAEALESLISDEQRGRDLADSAREHIEKHFDVKESTRLLREIFSASNLVDLNEELVLESLL